MNFISNNFLRKNSKLIKHLLHEEYIVHDSYVINHHNIYCIISAVIDSTTFYNNINTEIDDYKEIFQIKFEDPTIIRKKTKDILKTLINNNYNICELNDKLLKFYNVLTIMFCDFISCFVPEKTIPIGLLCKDVIEKKNYHKLTLLYAMIPKEIIKSINNNNFIEILNKIKYMYNKTLTCDIKNLINDDELSILNEHQIDDLIKVMNIDTISKVKYLKLNEKINELFIYENYIDVINTFFPLLFVTTIINECITLTKE